MAQIRPAQFSRKERRFTQHLHYAASFHCLVEERHDREELLPKPKDKWIFADKRMEAKKRCTELCAAAGKYRCMRCGRS